MKKYFKLSLSISIGFYLIASFVLWDITCVKNIPILDSVGRGLLVLSFIAKEMLTLAIYKIMFGK